MTASGGLLWYHIQYRNDDKDFLVFTIMLVMLDDKCSERIVRGGWCGGNEREIEKK
jgi:hypothetical protein